MATFEIDTGQRDGGGVGRIDVNDIILQTAQDLAGENATEEEVAIALADMIIRQLWECKKPATARRKLVRSFALIAPMAETAPDSFDKIFTEFAEMATAFR